MILKHKLMHHKRNDMIYRLFTIIVHIIHWFNPICYITDTTNLQIDANFYKNSNIQPNITEKDLLLY